MPANSALLIEELSLRVADAREKVAETSQHLQQAQQAAMNAQQQYNIWNGALQTILKEQAAASAVANEKQLPLPGTPSEATAATSSTGDNEQPHTEESPNKTEIIRELVRQHPMGISASEIWRQTGGQLKHRAYLYNVLKRLRDRDEITLRRNKYAIKPHPEVSQTAVVQ